MQAPKPKQPLELKGYFKLVEGTNQGYLYVDAEIEPGSYIYSTTQRGDLRPSQITPLPSTKGDYRIAGVFEEMQAPIVIAKDPVMQQRVEKHKGLVQFAIRFAVHRQANPKDVIAKIQFDGQVCSDQGVCMPIRGREVVARFAGYVPKQNATAKAPAATGQRTPGAASAPNRSARRLTNGTGRLAPNPAPTTPRQPAARQPAGSSNK